MVTGKVGIAQHHLVFIGAYANLLKKNRELEFSEFLEKYAPYSSEKELKAWLKTKGIIVISDNEMRAGNTALPNIIHTLEVAYS